MPGSEINIEVHLTHELTRVRLAVLGLDDSVRSQVFDSWSRTYLLFIRKRYIAAARGNGTWRPLAPATVQARKRKGGGRILILRDTDLLFENTTPSFSQVYAGAARGAKFSAIIRPGENAQYPNGVEVRHVMIFHQRGGPNLPKRVIIVPPDKPLSAKMAFDAKKIILKNK